MARVKGALIATSNYEVQVKKPLDARSLVPSYNDLTIKENWVKSGTAQVIAYNGMLVAVANTSDTSKNGLYMLFDINCTTALKSPDVTVESNWIKIGETSDISDFADRVATIEGEIDSIEERLTSLESRSDVETIGYRANFPSTGEPNKLYVAVDEQKSYVWVNDDYLPVGGSDYEDPEVIYGGSAE